MSRSLTAAGRAHVVLERGRVGERWRSERWESLRLLTPNWMNRLPRSTPHADRDGYLSGREFADYLTDYAASFDAPVREGTRVLDVGRRSHGFRVRTTDEEW